MRFVVSLGVRVLHRHPRAELHVRADRLVERPVVGHAGLVECLHVQLDEAPALPLEDLQVPVDGDQVAEAQLPRKAVRAAERLGRKRGQAVHVVRSALAEQRLQDRIGHDLAVEDLIEAVDRLFTARVLVE